MGTITKCADLARASRARLYTRVMEVGALCDDTEEGYTHFLKLGQLVHVEALLAYQQIEVPMALHGAPWLYIITRLKDEHGLKPDQVNMLSNAVTEFLSALAAGRAKAAV
jgi:hypothetical protein